MTFISHPVPRNESDGANEEGNTINTKSMYTIAKTEEGAKYTTNEINDAAVVDNNTRKIFGNVASNTYTIENERTTTSVTMNEDGITTIKDENRAMNNSAIVLLTTLLPMGDSVITK